MGELAGDVSGTIQNDKLAADTAVNPGTPENKFATDVPDIFADGEKNGMPVFDVSSSEFYNNMKKDRLRLRFKAGTPAQSYQSQSKYRRPFWVRNSDQNDKFVGSTYKIK